MKLLLAERTAAPSERAKVSQEVPNVERERVGFWVRKVS
jgi:hypothetical protein